MSYFIAAFKKYAIFAGRSTRREYWMFMLFNTAFLIAALILDTVFGTTIPGMLFGFFYYLYVAISIIPTYAITARRLHDVGQSGWMFFVVFIPLAGPFWLLYLLVKDSIPGINEYEQSLMIGSKFCQDCGVKNLQTARYCKKCGKELVDIGKPMEIKNIQEWRRGVLIWITVAACLGGVAYVNSSAVGLLNSSVKINTDIKGVSKAAKDDFICGKSQVEDSDGNMYKTVMIGGQCWTASNMNVGKKMESVSVLPADNGKIEKWCYDNSDANCAEEGGLYTWNEAMQYSFNAGTQGICPTGWHIPLDAEQYALERFLWDNNLNCEYHRVGIGCGGAATKMESVSGFNALLAGSRADDGNFNGQSEFAYFWSSSQYKDQNSAWSRQIGGSYSDGQPATEVVRGTALGQSSGFSVRCIKNDESVMMRERYGSGFISVGDRRDAISQVKTQYDDLLNLWKNDNISQIFGADYKDKIIDYEGAYNLDLLSPIVNETTFMENDNMNYPVVAYLPVKLNDIITAISFYYYAQMGKWVANDDTLGSIRLAGQGIRVESFMLFSDTNLAKAKKDDVYKMMANLEEYNNKHPEIFCSEIRIYQYYKDQALLTNALNKCVDLGEGSYMQPNEINYAVKHFVNNKDFKRAIILVKHAIELYPNEAKNLILLADLYRENGQFDKAKKTANEAVKINPTLRQAADQIINGSHN